MTTNIEFASPDENNNNEKTPWATPKESTYQNLVLKPEYESRRLKFLVGETWFRIVPALRESIHSWMMRINVINYEGGRFAHPRTLRQKAKSAFDAAYSWAREHHPESLYSKANKTGVRLLSDPMCAFWAILVEKEKPPVARLFLGSGYDGTRGGAQGLGYQIWSLTQSRDENGNLVADAVHPDKGVLIRVEKTQPKGAKYPSYALRLGQNPAPVDDLLTRMAPEEVASLCPLENAVRELSEEEEWQCLSKVMAPETVSEIRMSLCR